MSPSPLLILYPMFAMYALVFFVLMRMRSMRFAAVRGGTVSGEYYKAFEGSEPEPLRIVARHFANLFEMPLLFHVVAILIYVTGQVTYWLVVWAWIFVALRYVHTFIHLGSNNVLARFGTYFGSCMVLTVLWVTLLTQLLFASPTPLTIGV